MLIRHPVSQHNKLTGHKLLIESSGPLVNTRDNKMPCKATGTFEYHCMIILNLDYRPINTRFLDEYRRVIIRHTRTKRIADATDEGIHPKFDFQSCLWQLQLQEIQSACHNDGDTLVKKRPL